MCCPIKKQQLTVVKKAENTLPAADRPSQMLLLIKESNKTDACEEKTCPNRVCHRRKRIRVRPAVHFVFPGSAATGRMGRSAKPCGMQPLG
jgi:hypothetical protein